MYPCTPRERFREGFFEAARLAPAPVLAAGGGPQSTAPPVVRCPPDPRGRPQAEDGRRGAPSPCLPVCPHEAKGKNAVTGNIELIYNDDAACTLRDGMEKTFAAPAGGVPGCREAAHFYSRHRQNCVPVAECQRAAHLWTGPLKDAGGGPGAVAELARTCCDGSVQDAWFGHANRGNGNLEQRSFACWGAPTGNVPAHQEPRYQDPRDIPSTMGLKDLPNLMSKIVK